MQRRGEMLVAAAVEVHDGRPGRLRLARVADVSAASLHAFVEANVEAGATAKTDGWPAYAGAPGISHDPHVVRPMAAHIVLPWTHRVFANLKTWALGVYHGLRRKHLQAYLDEFVFRLQSSPNPTRRLPNPARIAVPSNPQPTTC